MFIQKNEETPIQSATLSKLMTEYIALEQLNEGNIQLDEVVKISNEVFPSRNESYTSNFER